MQKLTKYSHRRLVKKAIEIRKKELLKLDKTKLITILLNHEVEFGLLGSYEQARRELGLEC